MEFDWLSFGLAAVSVVLVGLILTIREKVLRRRKERRKREDVADSRVRFWQIYEGNMVAWGTHDPKRANRLFRNYTVPTYSRFDDPAVDFTGASRWWADPAGAVTEHWVSAQLASSEQEGWIPLLITKNPPITDRIGQKD